MGTHAIIIRSVALIAGGSALLCGAAGALTPPPSYVLAADQTTQLTLEQAGILNADGRQWAIALGKALFWDQQAGSDGNACASCHFVGGADTRLTNQLNPGMKDLTKGPTGDSAFGSEHSDTLTVAHGLMPSGAQAGANYTLKPEDMPLHKLVSEFDRNSPIITTTNDRVSSQGSFAGAFKTVLPAGLPDKCSKADGTIFHAGKFAARQVEPRNTPTTVNAAFFLRNFIDGRANTMFNGVGVFGMRDINGDPNKRLIVLNTNNQPQLGYLQIEDASLASQAVGPPLSELEMSCLGRTFADVGRKLLYTIPLLPQQVAKTDSVLGTYTSASGRGLALKHVYAALIMKAFDKKYWGAPGRYKIVDGKLTKCDTGYAQVETNFSMFWGIAIMLYEQSLVSDQSELDTMVARGATETGKLVPGVTFGPPGSNLCKAPNGGVDELLLRGCSIFMGANFGPPPAKGTGSLGTCAICHNAATTLGPPPPGANDDFNPIPFLGEAAFQKGEAMPLMLRVGSQQFGPTGPVNHTHDTGVMNIGVRPVFTDLLNGANDPYGNPLSYSRQYWNYVKNGNDLSKIVDPVLARAIANPAGAAHPLGGPGPAVGFVNSAFTLLGVDGAAKAPILRNVALTPPYFTWGGYPTLRHAMRLYNRGLNLRQIAPNPTLEAPAGTGCTTGDNSGTGPDGNQTREALATQTDCGTNTTGTVGPLGLIDCDDPDLATVCATKGYTSANDDLAALVRFLTSLTDRRVQCDAAPFDHPQLYVLNGHKNADHNHDGKADDIVFPLPAVGAAGYATTSGYCIPNAGDLFAPGMQARSGGAKVSL